jgi:hypothetical protein
MTAVKVSVDGAKASDKNPLFLSNETFKPYMRRTADLTKVARTDNSAYRGIALLSPKPHGYGRCNFVLDSGTCG